MKRMAIAAFLVCSAAVTSPAHATPVTWTFTGIADSGQWAGDPLAGLAYELRLAGDIDPADFDLGDWSNLSASIDVATLGTHVFAFCTTSSPASCSIAPFPFLETFRGSTADTFHFRGPQGVGDSRVNVALGALGPDDDELSALGPLQSNGDGLSHIVAQDGVPSNAVTPVFQLFDTDSPSDRITVTVQVGESTTVPEPQSSALLALGLGLLLFRRRYLAAGVGEA